MAVRRMMYGIFLVIAFWIFLVYVDYAALQILCSLVIVPLFTGIMTYVASRRVMVNLEVKDIYVVKKKTIQLYIKVINPSILPFVGARIEIEMKNSFSSEKVKKKIRVNLADREVNKFTLDISPEYLGKIDVSIKKIKLYDFTGIWSYKGKKGKNSVFYVLPANGDVNIKVANKSNEYIDEPVKYSENEPGDDCSQVFDVRAFREGDKVQRIHWKLSAKKGDIFVKEFSMPIDAAVDILMELPENNGNRFIEYADTIIQTAYALSVALLEQEIYHYIGWYNSKIGELVRKEIASENDIWNALYELYHMETYKENLAYRMYEDISENSNSHLFYITSNNEEVIKYMPHKIFMVGGNVYNENVVNIELGKVYESIKYLGEV